MDGIFVFTYYAACNVNDATHRNVLKKKQLEPCS